MSQPWIKVWQEKILSSMNLNDCNFTEHALFLEFLIRVRPDGEYAGRICYPNGKPIPDAKLWQSMKLKPSLYRKAKLGLYDKGVINLDGEVIVLRKFRELQRSAKAQLEHNSSTSGSSSIPQVIISKDLKTPTEEKRTDIDKDIYNAWNESKIINHTKLTLDMIKATKRELKDHTKDEIIGAIKNYGYIINNPMLFYFKYKWTLELFLKRGLKQFINRDIAISNFSKGGEICWKCKGNGETGGGEKEQVCSRCTGNPEVYTEQTGNECKCKGTGKELVKIPKSMCRVCRGKGRIEEK